MNRFVRRHQHTASQDADQYEMAVPVVLPLVVITIRSDATMTVTIDGAPYGPPQFAPPWSRASLAAILDQVTDQQRCPVRVQVREADGKMFTDIITPSTRQHRPPKPNATSASTSTPDATTRPAATAPAETYATITGDGFLPGEEVAVAVIVAQTDADPEGTVRACIKVALQASSPPREVILLGRVSGTLTLDQPR